jgi:hypothetical protein
MRLGASALLSAALTLPAAPCAAEKPARACIEAHAEGQVERAAGHLLRAREHFLACAAEPCPPMIRKECADLKDALVPFVPSIVLLAQDTRAQRFEGARATIDGNRSIAVGDGAPIELDPGVHRIEVVLADGRRQAFDLSLREAERSRRVVATFAAPQAPKPSEPSGNELAYVLGGVGLLALGTWGAFAWDGRSRQAELESCAPSCSDRSEVNAMRRSYLIADVLLGVSVVTLGSSAYLLISNATADERSAGRSLMIGASGRF